MNFRNAFPLIIGLTLSISACQSDHGKNNTIPLYIGTYTNSYSEGIYLASFDTISGELTNLQLGAPLVNPSYLTVHNELFLLFSVSENEGRKAVIHSIGIDSETGLLTAIDSLITGSLGACYISTIGNNMVAVANYTSGDVTFVPFTTEGKLSDQIRTYKHKGSGPNKERQKAPHAHSILPDPSGRYVYSADLGIDKILVYKFENSSLFAIGEVAITPGAGPRHIAFHPAGTVMAVLNELNHTIEVFSKDEGGIFTEPIQTISILNDSLHQHSTSADIHFSPDGRYLYASVRGVDKIEVISVDPSQFTLHAIQSVYETIHWPRNFTIDPSGRFLLVANQKGNNITVFLRDKETGMLILTEHVIEVDSPACLKF
jgi:6-phosphogluconolactonase